MVSTCFQWTPVWNLAHTCTLVARDGHVSQSWPMKLAAFVGKTDCFLTGRDVKDMKPTTVIANKQPSSEPGPSQHGSISQIQP